jgi:hypothetical protein
MKISGIVFAAALAAIASTSVFAQGQAPSQVQGGSRVDMGNSAKMDVTPFFKTVDTNKDGNIDIEEWKSAGLNGNIFSIFDSRKKNSFSKDEFAGFTHPSEIDANKDGKMTMEEFKDYTSNLASQGGAASTGGAPRK